jgi:GNAT superfamily N-acetyltransferase
MEDVFVEESFRERRYATAVIKKLIDEASKRCYKLIATSRHSRKKVHELYKNLGFVNHGVEFRMDFDAEP